MLRFTRHARNRMRRDGISEDDVHQCVEHPDETVASIEGRTNYIRNADEAFLRVTAIEEAGDLVIITVTLRRRRRQTR